MRAGQDRSLGEDGGRLFAALDALPEAAQVNLDLPAGPGRRARTARLAVRFAKRTLARPNRSFRAGLPDMVEMRLVDGRDGGPGPSRLCTDVFQSEDIPLLEAYCARLEGKTERQKNLHPKGSLAYAHGSAPGAADGQDITENPAPLSCSTDGSKSRPPSAPSKPSAHTSMCESSSTGGEGEGKRTAMCESP